MNDEFTSLPLKIIKQEDLLEISETLKLRNKFNENDIAEIFNSLDIEEHGQIPFDKFITRILEQSTKNKNAGLNELYLSLIKYFLTPSIRITGIIKRAIIKLKTSVNKDDPILKELEWVLTTLANKDLFDFEIKDEFFDSEIKDNYILSFISEYSSMAGIRKTRNFGSIKSPIMIRKSKLVDLDLEAFNFREVKEKITDYLKEIDNLNFNLFEFENFVGKERSMKILMKYILESSQAYSYINESKFDAFIDSTRKNYRDNPYHNETHAKDVLHTSYLIFKHGELDKLIEINEIDTLALMISSLFHDLNHPGLNNNYQINSMSKLALRYSDKSVLENYHISQSWKILMNNDSNIIDEFTKEEFRIFRKRLIDLILATDMANHVKISSTIKLRLESFNPNDNIESLQNVLLGENQNNRFERQQDILNFIIHSSDISNPSKKFEVYVKWVNKVTEEFFVQGDLEKQNNLPVSFLCDRNTTNIPKSQIGFMNNIVLPLFKMICLIVPQVKEFEKNIMDNIEIYQKMIEN